MSTETAAAKPPPSHDDPDRHFRTDHLLHDLKGRSVRGGAITLAAQAVKFVLQLTSTVVLARLLTPADFGLVAMVTAITGFVAIFSTMGLTIPTIQKPNVTHREVSTLFWVNLALGVLMGAVVAGLAPLLAWFYSEPALLPLTLVLSITFPIGCAGAQHHALLIRQMRQHAIVANDILTLAVSLVVGATMAFFGYGAWSLVGAQLAMNLACLAFLFVVTGWLPSLPSRGTGLRGNLRTGAGIAAHSVLGYVSRNADSVLIGRFWGASVLGIYGRAYQLVLLPIGQLTAPLFNVIMPSLSRLKDDPERFRAFTLRTLSLMTWLVAPLIAVLASVAPELFVVVLGERWRPSATVFQWLAVVAAFQPLSSLVVWSFMARGETRALLRYSMLFTGLSVAAFALGVPHGLSIFLPVYCGVFAALIVPVMLSRLANATRASVRQVVRAIAPPVGVGMALVALSLPLRMLLVDVNAVVVLALLLVFPTVIALVVCWFIPIARSPFADLRAAWNRGAGASPAVETT